ncbi:MAG: hypothetical protein EAZ36_02110 [Verrucomicrobia bacterium]|nr:MAG: hypothetical protein EAZ36_02110 [Verrucomicrobiota bacterium]
MKSLGVPTLWLLASTLPLAAIDLQPLVNRSPFAPPKDASGAVPLAEPGTLEFRGVVVDESGTAYSVFDAKENRGYWLREGVPSPFRVTSYRAQDGLLELEHNGRPIKLQLKRATIQAGAVITDVPRQAANPMSPAQVANGGDAGRLEAVAAEVRRRRALRNAASAATPVPTPPPANFAEPVITP